MSPVDVRLAAVLVDVERDWEQVVRHGRRAESADPSAGEAEAALVALSLDHAYQAFENLLLRVERCLGLAARSGGTWHRALLADAARALPDIRPALFPASAETDWEQLLGFRHFLRHGYAVDLDPARLEHNVERLTNAITATAPYVQALLAELGPE